MPNLLIADDHPLFRAALRGAAADAVAQLTVREAESLDGVIATLEAHDDIDLVLLDLHMPGNHGLAGLAAIRAQFPAVAVVVVSANDDPRVVRRALDH
nr:response regulator [Pseudoxanthomonas mexicana]